MPLLSAFADEISPDLGAALGVLKEAGLSCMELRAVDKVNVLDLSRTQVDEAKRALAGAGFTVGSIASPIGKVRITDDFAPQEAKMRRAVELAGAFGSKVIRVFSYYVPKGDEPSRWRAEVHGRVKRLVALAEPAGLTVVLENEEGLYGDTIERCAELIEATGSPALRLAFDPCNLVIIGPKPFTDAYPLAGRHLGYVHVKDWIRSTRTMVPAGEGDAEWRPILKALAEGRYDGVIALEPHLSAAGQFSGFTGPDLFRKAHAALTGLMREAGLEFR